MHMQICSVVFLLAVDITRVLASTIPHDDSHINFSLLDDHYNPLDAEPKDRNGGLMNKISQWFLGPELSTSARRHGQQGHHHPSKPTYHAPNYSKYRNDVVLRFNISNSLEAQSLANAADELYLDVWSTTKTHADIRMDIGNVEYVLNLLPESMRDKHTKLIHDLASTIRETYPASRSKSSRMSASAQDLFFAEYQPLNVISEWMKLHSILSPGHVEPITVGTSYEGRDIKGLRVFGSNRKNPNSKRQAIIVTGAAHAREWISVSTVCYLAYTFITHYNEKHKPNGKFDKDITDLVDTFDWYFIPTLNVDGYEYSWKEDRLWRKNRQPTHLRFCNGVELDRSYSFQWDAQSASNPCSENYPGEAPFEAMEAKAFSDWAQNLAEDNTQIIGFLDLHSYSQQILYPYSYSCTVFPPDLENLEELAMDLAKAIRMGPDGEHYEVQSACQGDVWQSSKPLSETGGGGSALDYFYGHLSVPYSYQIKLRDKGSYGFLLPARHILPTGEEAVAMCRRYGKFLKESVMTSRYHPKPGFSLRK